MGQNKIHENREEEIDLFEYWRAIQKRKRLIGLITSSVFAVSLAISLVLPKYYAASASVMPPQQGDLMSQAVASRLQDGAGGMAAGLLGLNSPSDLWVGILKSKTVADSIIDRFKLKEVYGEAAIEDARKKLSVHTSIVNSKENIVTVTVEDKDPQRAAAMANAFIEELDLINKSSSMTSGQRARAFLEKRLNEARAELGRLEGELKGFQERNKTVRLDEQSKAIIEAIGTVKGQLMAKEVEVQALLSYAAPENPKVQFLRSEAEGLKGKLKELEQGDGGGRNLFIPTDRIPGLAHEYASLVRDAKIQETVFEFLTQQFEAARIQEVKDSPTVQPLDTAKTPEKKSRPKRGVIVAASTAAGFILSAVLAVMLEFTGGFVRGEGAHAERE